MQLLDFARGPALQVALAIFVLGMVWRIVSLALLPRFKDKSVARPGMRSPVVAGLREIGRRSLSEREFAKRTMFLHVNGYLFHIGFFVVLFGFAPHIVFFKDLLGISWPGLPNNVIFAVGVLTVASLVAAVVRRFLNPVTRLLSNFDDYFSWLVTILPVLTGLIANSHLGLRYENMLAIHLLSVALLLIWFPFGKLMHSLLVFVTRAQTGAHLAHRGAQL